MMADTEHNGLTEQQVLIKSIKGMLQKYADYYILIVHEKHVNFGTIIKTASVQSVEYE